MTVLLLPVSKNVLFFFTFLLPPTAVPLLLLLLPVPFSLVVRPDIFPAAPAVAAGGRLTTVINWEGGAVVSLPVNLITHFYRVLWLDSSR